MSRLKQKMLTAATRVKVMVFAGLENAKKIWSSCLAKLSENPVLRFWVIWVPIQLLLGFILGRIADTCVRDETIASGLAIICSIVALTLIVAVPVGLYCLVVHTAFRATNPGALLGDFVVCGIFLLMGIGAVSDVYSSAREACMDFAWCFLTAVAVFFTVSAIIYRVVR